MRGPKAVRSMASSALAYIGSCMTITYKLTSSAAPHDESTRLSFPTEKTQRYTHYAFRFPAKFHPPVVNTLLETWSKPGDLCLDPFCGSGTLMVEATVAGRRSIGLDVDPLAIFISGAKSRVRDFPNLPLAIKGVVEKIGALQSDDPSSFRGDISLDEFNQISAAEGLVFPAIKNLYHWFRLRVLIQLARIKKVILEARLSDADQEFLLLCFASIIRRSSNADPTPVSGLEVTSHMRRLEAAGRDIDPIGYYLKAIKTGLADAEEYSRAAKVSSPAVHAADVRYLSEGAYQADVVITSPPYHNAVDYYRRHQLEVFWLDLTPTQAAREKMIEGYIGRPNVAKRFARPESALPLPPLAAHWAEKMRAVAPRRADDFLHYFWSMRAGLKSIAGQLAPGGNAIFIVGNSRFQGEEIPTDILFQEIAAGAFNYIDTYWYPIKNRYMSYARRNGANIDREFVVVFEKA